MSISSEALVYTLLSEFFTDWPSLAYTDSAVFRNSGQQQLSLELPDQDQIYSRGSFSITVNLCLHLSHQLQTIFQSSSKDDLSPSFMENEYSLQLTLSELISTLITDIHFPFLLKCSFHISLFHFCFHFLYLSCSAYLNMARPHKCQKSHKHHTLQLQLSKYIDTEREKIMEAKHSAWLGSDPKTGVAIAMKTALPATPGLKGMVAFTVKYLI